MTNGLPYVIAMLSAVSTVVIGWPQNPTSAAGLDGGSSLAATHSDDEVGPKAFVAASTSEATSLRLKRARDGLFYTVATVNGQRVRFVVDTGANVVVLSQADARRVGGLTAPTPGRGVLATVGGKTTAEWIRLNAIDVGGIEIHDVDAALPRQGPGLSLMGQNLLRRLGTITLSGDVMTISCAQSSTGNCQG